MRSRIVRCAAVVCSLLLVVSCGGDDDGPGDGAPTSTAPEPTGSLSDADLCALMEPDVVGEIFGGSGQLESPTGTSDRCGVAVATAEGSFTVVVTRFEEGKGADAELQERLDLDPRQELLDGVGDRALFDPETGLVMFVVADQRLQVAIPGRDGDRDQLIELARHHADRVRTAG